MDFVLSQYPVCTDLCALKHERIVITDVLYLKR